MSSTTVPLAEQSVTTLLSSKAGPVAEVLRCLATRWRMVRRLVRVGPCSGCPQVRATTPCRRRNPRRWRGPCDQQPSSFVVWCVLASTSLRGVGQAVVQAAGGTTGPKMRASLRFSWPDSSTRSTQSSTRDPVGAKAPLVAFGLRQVEFRREAENIGAFDGRGVQSGGSVVQRRASLPSNLEVAIGCVAQGGGHGFAAVWRPWNFVAGGGRSEGHDGVPRRPSAYSTTITAL